MGAFPNVSNVDVWSRENEFDYARWMADSVLKLCSVPWRGDYDNVVKFDSDQSRDAYFDGLRGRSQTLDTFFHILPETTVRVPLPVEVAQGYNYMVLTLPRATSAAQPIAYESANRKGRYFFFVDSCKQIAPNTTELHIHMDMWTTYINDVSITHMMLERGHAPMAAVSAGKYLSNPLENNRYLLAPDVSFGEPSNVAKQTAVVFNDRDVYAVIVTTANVYGGSDSWGTKSASSWKVVCAPREFPQGVPATQAFAVPVGEFSTFLGNVDTKVPQFKQTIEAVFFANSKLLNIGASFQFAGSTCYKVTANQHGTTLAELSLDDFGYPPEYAAIAKLYTSPYCHLELYNAVNGARTVVKVEDTTGKLMLRSTLNLSLPYLNVDAVVEGIGSSAVETISYTNVTARTFKAGGEWYSHLMGWNVPTFAVYQDPAKANDYATHYQRKVATDNTAVSTKCASDNNAVTVATNALNTATSNAASASINTRNNTKLISDSDADTSYQTHMLVADLEYVSSTNQINNAATVAGAAVGTATSIVSGAAQGAAAGPAGAAAGAIGGLVSSAGTIAGAAISVSAANATLAVNISKSNAVYGASLAQITYKTNNAASANNDNIAFQTEAQTKITADSNTASTAMTTNSNTAATTATANSNAAQVAAASIGAPSVFGSSSNGEYATTRPQGIFASVVTQPVGAIAAAGDQMLRYGYQLGQAWRVGDLCLMPAFTYWKASDLWITSEGVVEAAQEAIRDIFNRGVTVWRDPAKMGRVSIYDN